MNIPLGYEIGIGKRVTIPVNHTVVLGQTQLSGKTTTLEAMITRSGVRAVGFITKPGEKSFRLQTQIPAFFSESTSDEYWKYVCAIVEGLVNIKLGWRERGWIIKLCQDYEKDGTVNVAREQTKKKGSEIKMVRERYSYSWKRPKTLAALLENVETALPYLKGAEEMICIQLREYLKPVVREIDQIEFSSKLELEQGINVMDVTELSDGLKALVIRSVIEWVHKRGRKIVVIIPEAWKFIPEGRSTPVKLALEGLIREGAGVGNFVWMDSQDLRGVDKLLLRSVIVWLFGVQRQKNEVASTLASIPDHPKPSATEIMQLGKGEFFVAYGSTLIRTYVQPAGMEDAHAQAIARGEESPDSWRQIAKALDEETETQEQVLEESEIRRASDRLGSDVAVGELGEPEADAANQKVGETDRDPENEDESMWKEKYEALEADYKTLIKAHDALAARIRKLEPWADFSTGGESALPAADNGTAGGVRNPDLSPAAPVLIEGLQLETVYEYVRARAEKDPGILELLKRRPELRVTVERQVIEADGKTLRGALATLICERFFDTPKNGNAAFKEIQRMGRRTAKPNVYRELDTLAEMGFVTKEDAGYQAVPGMKVHVIENHSAKPQEKGAAAR
jgi:hypothetical protein